MKINFLGKIILVFKIIVGLEILIRISHDANRSKIEHLKYSENLVNWGTDACGKLNKDLSHAF